jgi:hypothetical protein
MVVFLLYYFIFSIRNRLLRGKRSWDMKLTTSLPPCAEVKYK